MENDKKVFFENANLADLVTIIGECEHCFMHACKAAAASEKEEAVFYQTMADLIKDFRRRFMKEHFPDVEDRDWCLLKSCDSLRQRVYESAHTSHEDLKGVNDIWSEVTEHIFGVDMSGCSACANDKKTPQE